MQIDAIVHVNHLLQQVSSIAMPVRGWNKTKYRRGEHPPRKHQYIFSIPKKTEGRLKPFSVFIPGKNHRTANVGTVSTLYFIHYRRANSDSTRAFCGNLIFSNKTIYYALCKI